ncbi:MAG: DUF4236 domain-containing protein [Terriglobia bacterium]
MFRRVRIARGITLIVAKHGPSMSFGMRGAHLTVGRSGVRRTVGLPGTGVLYTTYDGWHSGIHTGLTFHDAAGTLTGWRRAAHGMLLIVPALIMVVVVVAILGAILAR